MRATQYFLQTLRKPPSNAEMTSHKLLARGGFMRRVAPGVYTLLPLGWRVVRKVQEIVREELNVIGAHELMMPTMHPISLWKQSGRLDIFEPLMFRLIDNRKRSDFVLGPTHEAIVTDLVKGDVRSYRQLPLLLYQIQTKARDEVRTRGGLIRCREFIMQDLYSFDADEEGLNESYHRVYHAYERIFERIGLDHVIAEASGGPIGGSETREFHVLCESGEDEILLCDHCGYTAALEVAAVGDRQSPPDDSEGAGGSDQLQLQKVVTPGAQTVDQVTKMLDVPANKLVKTMICVASGRPIAALVRGDRELNEAKLKATLDCETLEMADAETVEKLTSAPVGFAGPVGLSGVKVVADREIKAMTNFVTGANEADAHLTNVNLERDFTIDVVADIRNAVDDDPCPKCDSQLRERRGIEVAHIFKLGDIYTNRMGATFTDADGKERPPLMGCYGLGITRTIAAMVEISHDENGIIWPTSVAPFQAVILLLNTNDEAQLTLADELYAELTAANAEVLFDDRNERPGAKFKDADLIGVPVQIVVGRHAGEGKVEIQLRTKKEKVVVEKSKVGDLVKSATTPDL